MTITRYGGGRPRNEDAEPENDVVASGRATKNQLAKLFRVDKNNVERLLDGLPPVRRGKYPLYDIADAAQMLVKPGYDVEERIMRMNRADLPAGLGAEFWSGQKSRLTFEIAQGDHWRTDDVLAVFAEVFADMSLFAKLLSDRVERVTSLSVEARNNLRRIMNGWIDEAREKLVTKYEGRAGPVDNIASGGLLERSESGSS